MSTFFSLPRELHDQVYKTRALHTIPLVPHHQTIAALLITASETPLKGAILATSALATPGPKYPAHLSSSTAKFISKPAKSSMGSSARRSWRTVLTTWF
ncbi:hypothetical protein K505DRAFT_321749 [Melanomma pulvis-pyrius CBS 109.77]|uniref:Uncharacterized protein n=1 Tax=Melanomma pulvis-pyrius CBS 109.77 TaxID=1314802 RepID=A0A6A6XR20_9PLEO|nr:hypothetical protein K505DRAFT_321749 [Melanomma pulvis-pyrius CBS 109.77]